MQQGNAVPPLSRIARRIGRRSRFLTPTLLALGLLWVASPLLHGQNVRDVRRSAYQRAVNLRLQQICRRHLQLVSLAIAQYAADNDGLLPALDSPETLRKQIAKYRISGGNLVCPMADKDYRTNKSLAGKKLKDIPNPGKTLMLWSPKPLPNGTYMALTVNGQRKQLRSGQMSAYRK